MLPQFLTQERDAILVRCRSKLLAPDSPAPTKSPWERALPVLYDEFLDVWERRVRDEAKQPGSKLSLRMGFTVSQVVQAYGAVSQSVTEHAAETGDSENHLNAIRNCLDAAIAEVVTDSADLSFESSHRERMESLGELARDMRNAVSTAMISQLAIESGMVDARGGTARCLTKSLTRIRDLIDDSLSEARLQGDPILRKGRVRVVNLISEIEATVVSEARDRGVIFDLEVDPEIEVLVDGPLILSAISNVLKSSFTRARPGDRIHLRGYAGHDRVVIEVQDEADDFPVETVADEDETGLMLSRLTLALHAASFSKIDRPGIGRTLRIELPRAYH